MQKGRFQTPDNPETPQRWIKHCPDCRLNYLWHPITCMFDRLNSVLKFVDKVVGFKDSPFLKTLAKRSMLNELPDKRV